MICICGGCGDCLKEQRESWIAVERENFSKTYLKEIEGDNYVNSF